MLLLTAHWTTGRGNGLMAPSYGLLDLTAVDAPPDRDAVTIRGDGQDSGSAQW